jgi:hypothetical protein
MVMGMSKSRVGNLLGCFTLALGFLLLSPAAGAQEATPQPSTSSVTVTVHNCLPGATPDSVGGEACSIVTEGFGLSIGSLEGIMEPLTLADATFDGTSYRWELSNVGPGVQTDWLIKESPLPEGYESFMAVGVGGTVVGDFYAYPDGSGYYPFTVTYDVPNASIFIYNFLPAAEPETTPAPATSTTTVTALPSTGSNPSSSFPTLPLIAMLVFSSAACAGSLIWLRRRS